MWSLTNPESGSLLGEPEREIAVLAQLPDRLRALVRAAEAGFSMVEVLVATAVVAVLIVGTSYVYGSQRGSTAREVNADTLRDVASAVDVDASAIAAYDDNARAAFSSLATLSTVVTVNGTATTVKVGGTAGALSVTTSTSDGSQAALLAPLPPAKPLPQ